MESLATILLLVAANWSAHKAGAAYILGKEIPKIRQYAIARSVVSVLAMILIVSINWRTR